MTKSDVLQGYVILLAEPSAASWRTTAS